MDGVGALVEDDAVGEPVEAVLLESCPGVGEGEEDGCVGNERAGGGEGGMGGVVDC